MNETITPDLSAYRIEKAKDLLNQAEALLKLASYDGSINRSYYAIFNAIRALLALVGLDSQKHTGVIAFLIDILSKQASVRRCTVRLSIRHLKPVKSVIIKTFIVRRQSKRNNNLRMQRD